MVMSNKTFVSSVRTSSFPNLNFNFLPRTSLMGDRPYIMTYNVLPKQGVTASLCSVRDEEKTSRCTLGASVVPLVMVIAKWIRRTMLLHAKITKDCMNHRYGKKRIDGSHPTITDRRTSKVEERCPFACTVFLDSDGWYFLKLPLILFSSVLCQA
jgi:hypothetical protein